MHLSCLPDPAGNRLPVPVLQGSITMVNFSPVLILQETGLKPASMIDVSV